MNEQQLNRALFAMSQQRNQALDEVVRLQVELAQAQEELEALRKASAPVTE